VNEVKEASLLRGCRAEPCKIKIIVISWRLWGEAPNVSMTRLAGMTP
jgi:hypothetical protein